MDLADDRIAADAAQRGGNSRCGCTLAQHLLEHGDAIIRPGRPCGPWSWAQSCARAGVFARVRVHAGPPQVREEGHRSYGAWRRRRIAILTNIHTTCT